MKRNNKYLLHCNYRLLFSSRFCEVWAYGLELLWLKSTLKVEPCLSTVPTSQKGSSSPKTDHYYASLSNYFEQTYHKNLNAINKTPLAQLFCSMDVNLNYTEPKCCILEILLMNIYEKFDSHVISLNCTLIKKQVCQEIIVLSVRVYLYEYRSINSNKIQR